MAEENTPEVEVEVKDTYVALKDLSEVEKSELLTTYAVMLLSDSEGTEITAENLNKVISAADGKVDSHWTATFASALAGKDISELLKVGGGGGGSAGGDDDSDEDESSEEEEEDESDDEGGFGLF
eukprot:516970_1